MVTNERTKEIIIKIWFNECWNKWKTVNFKLKWRIFWAKRERTPNKYFYIMADKCFYILWYEVTRYVARVKQLTKKKKVLFYQFYREKTWKYLYQANKYATEKFGLYDFHQDSVINPIRMFCKAREKKSQEKDFRLIFFSSIYASSKQYKVFVRSPSTNIHFSVQRWYQYTVWHGIRYERKIVFWKKSNKHATSHKKFIYMNRMLINGIAFVER